MRRSRERDWTGGRAFDSELRIAPPFALEGRGFVFPALRCHSDRAKPGAGSTWSPRNTTRNPSFFYGSLNLPGAPPYACEKVLRVPVPGFHRAQGFAVFERSRSFFACADRSSRNRR